jgi:hypothetical protein
MQCLETGPGNFPSRPAWLTISIIIRLWSSGLWHRVVLRRDTDVLDEHGSIFKVEYDSTMFLRNVGIRPRNYTVSQPRGLQS